MKKNKRCPKCNSENIGVRLYDKVTRNRIPVDNFYSVGYEIYICRNCGYIEYFVRDKDLSKTEYMDDLNKK